MRFSDTRVRTSAAAIAGGVVASSITVLVVTTLVGSAPHNPARTQAAPATQAQGLPSYRAAPVVHPRPAPHHKRVHAHAANRRYVTVAPARQQQAPASSGGSTASTVPTVKMPNWRQIAARSGVPSWALKMISP